MPQPAWKIAKQWHEKYIPNFPFAEAVVHYLKEGIVYSSPEIFVCGREVLWDGSEVSVSKHPNAWFVYMAASSNHSNPVREFMRVAPRAHEWAVWHRRNEARARVFNWASLAERVGL